MDQLKELESTFLEEYESAKILIGLSKNKSAIILLSKALFALTDYIIFKKYKKLPKNHSERFRILKEKEFEVYEKLDKIWDKYTNSYSKPTLNESIALLRNTIKEIIEKNEAISKKIKESVKK
ncbi:MAG: hypothetical protein KKA61_04230 [Nanoarchaeota archaeon]|nr:hypothetical protein [Nanoarchaeota archaeon]MBU4283750.1 hypothetical protein [Nanoarchaeota archaeon]MBU4493553.1 hypothetical protein [Nanoarchaeota archaeon]